MARFGNVGAHVVAIMVQTTSVEAVKTDVDTEWLILEVDLSHTHTLGGQTEGKYLVVETLGTFFSVNGLREFRNL